MTNEQTNLPIDANEDDATVVRARPTIVPTDASQGRSTRELARTLTGEMLDHFLLQDFVGGGGMGVVFRALDTTLDRVVAVKVVASQQLSGEDLQRRFLVEAQSTARLDHPNIARVHYIGRDLGLPYIVFEFIDGVNIRDLVTESGPLPLGDALNYTHQIAHALAHAWQRDVVHRDIKPSNILVTADGQAKLVDMGLARLSHVDAVEEDLTATGVTLGTFDYIAPEQARDARDADTRSDIYSLGCTLYYMLTGEPPFSSERAVQKLLAHQSEPPPDVRILRPDLPETIGKLLEQLLAKSPDDRPSDPIVLTRRLMQVAERLEISLSTAQASLPISPQYRAPTRWGRQLAWATPVAGVFLAAAIADSRLANRGEVEPFAPVQPPRVIAFDPADAHSATDSSGAMQSVDSSASRDRSASTQGEVGADRLPSKALAVDAAVETQPVESISAMSEENRLREGALPTAGDESSPVLEQTSSESSRPSPPGSQLPALGPPAK